MTKVTTGLTLVLLLGVIPVQLFVTGRKMPPEVLRNVMLLVGLAVLATLAFTFLLAPRAVRLDATRLVVERLGWSDFEVPLRQVQRATLGPSLEVMGKVRRVAGNGGVMGFTGLFHLQDVGTVRCWATRLGRPTVLVYRSEGRPLLLGVDDAAGLLAALRQRGVRPA